MKGSGDQGCASNCGACALTTTWASPASTITYEDVKRAADANGTTVEQALETIAKTAEKDRGDHPAEYQNA